MNKFIRFSLSLYVFHVLMMAVPSSAEAREVCIMLHCGRQITGATTAAVKSTCGAREGLAVNIAQF